MVAPVTKPTEHSRGRRRISSGDLFRHRRSGRYSVSACVLSPGAGQHIGGDADGMRCAEHPPEKARPGRSRKARLGCRIQRVNDGRRILADFGRRPVEQCLQLDRGDYRPWRTIGKPIAEVARVLECALENPAMLRRSNF